MAVSSSSFADRYFPLNVTSSELSLFDLIDECVTSTIGLYIHTAYSTTSILIFLPLCFAVCLGCRHSRQQHSSPGDVLTYHMIAMQLIETLGSVLYSAGGFSGLVDLMIFGHGLFISIWPIKLNFFMLSGVERYMAVIHPVTYRRLKGTGGARFKHVIYVLSWLIPFVLVVSLSVTTPEAFIFVYLGFLGLSSITISFCSLSVLCALKHPGPGEVSKNGKQVDRSKQKAFRTVMIIMVAALLCIGGMLVCHALFMFRFLSSIDSCVVVMCSLWFSVPSGLVIVLMYMYRNGILTGCNAESG